jgi:hypothetical protein
MPSLPLEIWANTAEYDTDTLGPATKVIDITTICPTENVQAVVKYVEKPQSRFIVIQTCNNQGVNEGNFTTCSFSTSNELIRRLADFNRDFLGANPVDLAKVIILNAPPSFFDPQQ